MIQIQQQLTDCPMGGDNGMLVRAAALEPLARRGDPSELNAVLACKSDETDGTAPRSEGLKVKK
jgi:hypothetical protein